MIGSTSHLLRMAHGLQWADHKSELWFPGNQLCDYLLCIEEDFIYFSYKWDSILSKNIISPDAFLENPEKYLGRSLFSIEDKEAGNLCQILGLPFIELIKCNKNSDTFFNIASTSMTKNHLYDSFLSYEQGYGFRIKQFSDWTKKRIKIICNDEAKLLKTYLRNENFRI